MPLHEPGDAHGAPCLVDIVNRNHKVRLVSLRIYPQIGATGAVFNTVGCMTYQNKLFLAGSFVDASDGGTFDVTNPRDGSVITSVASATEEDVKKAFDAACEAQEAWAKTSPRYRADILWRAYEEIMERKDEIAELMTLELGRALPDSQGESVYGAEFFRWFAAEAERMSGDYRLAPTGNARIVEVQQPVGPVLAITPWNFPLAMGTRKLGPALAAGCTVVLKPASKTPLTILLLAEILDHAGLDKGVVSILPCSSAALEPLYSDSRLRKLTFTGSTAVGKELAAKVPTAGVSLELGGNAPFVVLSDADLTTAVEAASTAKMRGAGQVCIAANRFIVHRDLHADFVAKVTESLKGSEYGPLSGDDQVEKVTELVQDAVDQGAELVWQDEVPEKGSWFPLTILDNVPTSARMYKEEIFGPVVAVYEAASDEEAIAMANDTNFGLAGYLFSADLQHALDSAEKLEVGMVGVNKGGISDAAAPFGGVKDSGLGREGGFQGIEEFLERKLISLPAPR